MSKRKIITVVGARPQFIKAAVVSRSLLSLNDQATEVIVHTGQHFDANMSDVFFDELDIPKPNYHLGIGGGTHGQNTGRMLEKIEEVLLQEKPDAVLVYGDTDSTLAGVLAAVKLHIPVAHVEAGLRSFNKKMPEEINRILTDHAADILFTPTSTGSNNLVAEGVAQNKIVQVGDVMFDAALYYTAKAAQNSTIIQQTGIVSKEFVLMTLHRAENADSKERLSSILEGLERCAHTVVWPVHPRTKKKIKDFNLTVPANIIMIDPVGYLDMIMLLKNAAAVATDSGGVQKEAYFHKVPCVTLRDETEWTELVTSGANILAGADPESITKALEQSFTFNKSIFEGALYGNGDAGQLIAGKLVNGFS